jgi:GAF domain-containing protein
MKSRAEQTTITAGDRGLEHLSARLAGAQTRSNLEDTLALIAAELNADKICLSVLHGATGVVETLAENGKGSNNQTFSLDEYPTTAAALNGQVAAQVMVGDPASDPAEAELLLRLGHRSLLMVPVVHRGESLGLIEAFRDREDPWTRSEINRARIISNQFASVIDGFFLESDRREYQSSPTRAE